MKKSLYLLSGVLAAVLLFGGSVFADDTYMVAYYSNANTASAPDGTLRLTNTGATVASGVSQPLNANIYVFDDTEQLQECCACQVSPDGMLSESVNLQLTGNNLLHTKLTAGVIKIVASTGTPDPTSVTSIAHGMAGWTTQTQGFSLKLNKGKWAGPFTTTQSELWQSTLTAAELVALTSSCSSVQTLGSGKGRGVCGCTQEGTDF
jgi:hypothetical protein